MKRSFAILFFTIIFIPANFSYCFANEESNKLGNHGLQLINQGKGEEGLAELKQAAAMDKKEPSWHMNYGSMLFQKAQAIHQAGQVDVAKPLFEEAERELVSAAELLDEKTNNHEIAQCYYLIGDIYFYVYQKPDRAKEFYTKSIVAWPEHTGAIQGLNNYANFKAGQTLETKKQAVPPSIAAPASRPVESKAQSTSDTIFLKNGQVLSGTIVEKDKKGLWFEVDAGARVYVANNEIKKMTQSKPVPVGSPKGEGSPKKEGQSENHARPCSREDILGSWDVMGVGDGQGRRIQTGHRYERFIFYGDGTLQSLGGANPISEADVAKMKASSPPGTYEMGDRGVLKIIFPNAPDRPGFIQCLYVAKGHDEPGQDPTVARTGDMIFNAYNDDSTLREFRILRKTGQSQLPSSSLPTASAFDGVKPCRKGDLIGTWDITAVVDGNFNPMNNVNTPYGRYIFYKDGKMQHAASTRPLDEMSLKLMKLHKPEVSYDVSGQGKLSLHYPDFPGQPAVFECSCSAKTGEVLLTVRGPDKNVQFSQVLKKAKE